MQHATAMLNAVPNESTKKTPLMLCGLLALATGCGTDVDTPTEEDYQEIAQSVAPLVRAELSSDGGAQLSAQVAVGQGPAWLSVQANGEVGGTLGQVNWSLDASCQDVNDQPLDLCDSTTNSARVASSFDGMLTLPNYAASVSAEVDVSVSGLQTDTLVATGETSIDASTQFTGIFRPVSSSFALDFDASYELTIPVQDPGAIQGTLRGSIDAQRRVTGTNNDRDAHFIVDAVITIDGSGSAIITLDGQASFSLNLASGELTVHAST